MTNKTNISPLGDKKFSHKAETTNTERSRNSPLQGLFSFKKLINKKSPFPEDFFYIDSVGEAESLRVTSAEVDQSAEAVSPVRRRIRNQLQSEDALSDEDDAEARYGLGISLLIGGQSNPVHVSQHCGEKGTTPINSNHQAPGIVEAGGKNVEHAPPTKVVAVGHHLEEPVVDITGSPQVGHVMG